MNLLFKPAIAFFSSYLILSFSSTVSHKAEIETPKKIKNSSKIQAAILLDVSNSMDGPDRTGKSATMDDGECNGQSKMQR
jgi:hypothetical protein